MGTRLACLTQVFDRATAASASIVLVALSMLTVEGRSQVRNPDQDIYSRYHSLLERYVGQADEAAVLYRREIVGAVTDGYDKPIPETQVMEKYSGARGDIVAARAALDAAHADYLAGKSSLADYLRAGDRAVQRAIDKMWTIDLDLTGWQVSALDTRRRHESRDIDKAYSDGRTALEQRYPQRGSEFDAAVAKLRDDLTAKERGQIELAIKDYKAIQNHLGEYLKAMAGDTWILQDFNERRERHATAEEFRTAVYSNFCFRLGDRDPKLLTQLFGNAVDKNSALDFFVVFPGSPDRLIVRAIFNRAPDSGKEDYTPALANGLWKMDAFLADYPVEKLRKYDSALPPLDFAGGDIEQMSRILSSRLVRFYLVTQAQDATFRDIQKAVDGAGPAAPLPDTSKLPEMFKAAMDKQRVYADAKRERDMAQSEFDRAAGAATKAQQDLDKATASIGTTLMFVDNGDAVAAAKPGARGARSAKDLLKVYKDRIALLKLNNRPTEQWEQRVADIEKAIAAALQPLQDALTKALTDKDSAAKKLQEVAGRTKGIKPEDAAQAYLAAKQQYDAAVAALPPDARKDLAALPAKPDDYPGDAVLKKLDERIAQVRRERQNAQYDLLAKLSELQRNDSELNQLARSIANDRAAGEGLADKTLSDLGAADEGLAKAFETLKAGLDEGKSVLTKSDRGMQVLEKLTKDAEGTTILKEVREHTKTISEAFKLAGETAERIATAIKLSNQFEAADPRSGLDALGTLLDLTSSTAEKVPVMGQTLGRFLGFYSKAAVACGQAAVRIQDKIIETNLNTAFSNPPPERHLYLRSEIENGALSLQNANVDRITNMLQVRRLITLVHATGLGEAREVTRP
jgi:hypothetical protein